MTRYTTTMRRFYRFMCSHRLHLRSVVTRITPVLDAADVVLCRVEERTCRDCLHTWTTNPKPTSPFRIA